MFTPAGHFQLIQAHVDPHFTMAEIPHRHPHGSTGVQTTKTRSKPVSQSSPVIYNRLQSLRFSSWLAVIH